MSHFFYLKRGCRQGDPISPYIFILCAEILGKMIRNNNDLHGIIIDNKEYKISQYADDTQLFLNGSENSLRETLDILQKKYTMSGLRMNAEKTKAIWIGSLSNSTTIMCHNFNLDWTQGPFKILGVTFSTEIYNIWDLNYNEIIKKVDDVCKQWSKRKLTLMGRITIIKSLALAKFIHLLLVLPNPPDNLLTNIEKIFYKFYGMGVQIELSEASLLKTLKQGDSE